MDVLVCHAVEEALSAERYDILGTLNISPTSSQFLCTFQVGITHHEHAPYISALHTHVSGVNPSEHFMS